jgi:hypothetical protein
MFNVFSKREWTNESILQVHEGAPRILMMITPAQIQICERYGTLPLDAPSDLKAGVATNVRSGIIPVNGLRHRPEGDTTGWFIWAGEELSDDPNFFVPIHVEHLRMASRAAQIPRVAPRMAVPFS